MLVSENPIIPKRRTPGLFFKQSGPTEVSRIWVCKVFLLVILSADTILKFTKMVAASFSQIPPDSVASALHTYTEKS